MKSSAREEYEAMVGGALSCIWRREGDFLTVDPVELNTPLTAVLEAEEGLTRVNPDKLPVDLEHLEDLSWEEMAGVVREMMEERLMERERMQTVFFDFLFGAGPDPLAVMERLFAYVRARSRDHVWGAKQAEIAALLGHSKQNWQHLEERMIEDLVTRWSRTEFVNSGGKSVSARLAYAKQRKGNQNRKLGRRRGDDLPPLPAKEHDHEPLCGQAKRRAAQMADWAERKRLAGLIGCEPEEVDLNLISPTER